jgi:hypothetical protein
VRGVAVLELSRSAARRVLPRGAEVEQRDQGSASSIRSRHNVVARPGRVRIAGRGEGAADGVAERCTRQELAAEGARGA